MLALIVLILYSCVCSNLDDLVKASRQNAPKKTSTTTPAKKVKGKKTGPNTNTPKTAKTGNKANIKTNKSQNSSQKLAKSVGTANAKRAALTNQVTMLSLYILSF